MKSECKDGVLTVWLEGRIDSNNAAEAEAELMEAYRGAPGATLRLDADRLDYISSAGLRALMKLRKAAGKPVEVDNVSPEVYEIFEVTGFSELLDVRKKLRQVSVEGCELLGEGANGKVYRFTDDEMIKVFRPGITLEEIEQEREASRRAFLLGVPCAISFDTVRCGESYGTIYELLKAATLTERIRENPETLPRYAEASARLLREMHQIEVPAGQMQKASRLLYKTADALTADFTPEELALIRRLYDAIPEMHRFVHNDYHSKNIMESKGELILIDLGDAGEGNPLIDLIHCRMVYNLIGGGIEKNGPDAMGFIGMTYGEMKQFWDIFLPTYCGSEEEAQRLDRILEPYAVLMYLTVSMAHPILPAQYHPIYARQLRDRVFPHAEEMLESMAGLTQ